MLVCIAALTWCAASPAFDVKDEPPIIVEEAIERLALRRNGEGLAALGRNDYAGAQAAFQEAYRLDPDNPEIVNNLGYLHQLLGHWDEAEPLLRQTLDLDPARLVAYRNLADVLSAPGRSPEKLIEAASLLDRARSLREPTPDLILDQARMAARLHRFDAAEGFFDEYRGLVEADDALRLELGDFYRDFGRTEEALEWYRAIDADSTAGETAKSRLWEIDVAEQARRYGWTRTGGEVPEQARVLTERARAAAGAGRPAEAEALLRRALDLSADNAEAHAELGDVLVALDRRDDAETAYLRAIVHESGNANWYARLGEFYLDRASPPRPSEAAGMFERALQLAPERSRYHLRLAYALRATGNLGAALVATRAYLARSPKEAEAVAARALESQLSQLVKDAGQDEETFRSPVEPPPGARSSAPTLARIRAHLARGETDAAMAALERIPAGDREPEMLDIEAGILVAAGRLEDAAKVIREALDRNDADGALWARYGSILSDLHRDAEGRSALRRAEKLGSAEAAFWIARQDLVERRSMAPLWLRDMARLGTLSASLRRLETFVAAEPYSPNVASARELRRQAAERLFAALAAWGGLVVGLAVAVFTVRARRWGGATLADLVERYPDVSSEIRRVLAAIRHEVLKHHTMALAGVIDGLRNGEPVGERAGHLMDSLFGAKGDAGVHARLINDLEQLEQMGRARSLRLNLRRRDPATSALVRGFARLRRVAGAARRADRLGHARRRRLLRALETSAADLNETAHAAIDDLLSGLRVTDVSADGIRELFERVRREPAFRGRAVEPLALRMRARDPLRLMMPRPAFEDVLGNLIRNALSSTLNEGVQPAEIGLDVSEEVDDVTGIERLVFAVKDRAAGRPDIERLGDRPVEHGLGLVADHLSRYEGAMEWRDSKGWSKALAVRLPRAGEADNEDFPTRSGGI